LLPGAVVETVERAAILGQWLGLLESPLNGLRVEGFGPDGELVSQQPRLLAGGTAGALDPLPAALALELDRDRPVGDRLGQVADTGECLRTEDREVPHLARRADAAGHERAGLVARVEQRA